MRVDASQVLAQGGVKVKSGDSSFMDSLKKGDVVKATVVSADKNGTLNLKTESGQTFSAKLDTDIKLGPGDTILLEVSEKDEKQIALTFSGIETPEEELPAPQANLVRDFSDKSLAPYASKLAELNMNVTESSAQMMRDLMAQYPDMSMDEAAFIATNKLGGDESLMKAALAVLAGGDTTDVMIYKLIEGLKGQDFLVNSDLGTRNPENSISGSTLPSNFTPESPSPAPLTEFITMLVKNSSSLLASSNQVDIPTAHTSQTIITQPDSNMQLNNQLNVEDILQQPPETDDGKNILQQSELPAQAQGDDAKAVNIQTAVPEILTSASDKAIVSGGAMQGNIMQEGAVPGSAVPEGAVQGNVAPEGAVQGNAVQEGAVPGNAMPEGAALGNAVSEGIAPSSTAMEGAVQGNSALESAAITATVSADQAISESEAAQRVDNPVINTPEVAEGQSGEVKASSEQAETLGSKVAQLLAEMPEFKGTPAPALDRFSDMLLRVAKDTSLAQDSAAIKDLETLTSQLEKMFTKINRNDTDAGMRLREAREELFARLTLIQEEITRASQPVREQLLTQTQKLMDHVKLLNNIDQFVYMQLPVKLKEDNKAAELYVFKRKGGKRGDPDNVNILLSIDLEFMGHWEALLNIKGKDVYVNMEVAGEAEKQHFSENTVLLYNMLNEEGFKLVNTNIKVSEVETTPLTALNAFERYTGGNRNRVNIVI